MRDGRLAVGFTFSVQVVDIGIACESKPVLVSRKAWRPGCAMVTDEDEIAFLLTEQKKSTDPKIYGILYSKMIEMPVTMSLTLFVPSPILIIFN